MARKRHDDAPEGPTIDRTYGHSGAREAVRALDAGSWEPAHALLTDSRNWHERELLVEIVGTATTKAAALDGWVESEASSSIPWLVRGAYVAHQSWLARVDSGFAAIIGDGASDPVIHALSTAEDDLWQAAELDPADPTPFTHLLRTGRALQLDAHELVKRFEEADRREHHLAFAHDELLQALSPRWHSDGELLFSFATLASQEAPEGDPVHRLIPRAHLEYYWSLHENPRQQDAYRDVPDVLVDIRAAADRSVTSMRAGDGPQTLVSRNVFALAFVLFGDHERARAQFAAIGDHPTPDPWDTFGDGAEGAYVRQRNVAAGAA